MIKKANESIVQSIKQFYKNNANSVYKREIDADENIMIFLYIISKTDCNQLLSHCKFVEKFCSEESLNSISGYYLATFSACINHLIFKT